VRRFIDLNDTLGAAHRSSPTPSTGGGRRDFDLPQLLVRSAFMPTFPDALRRRLARPLPGLEAQLRLAPRPRSLADSDLSSALLRPAAALLLIYPDEEGWSVPLTVRGSGLRHHTGQVSLPGGRLDEGESVEEAALREAHEEVGIAPADVEVLGRLTPLPVVVSDHLLHPVVGVATRRPRFSLAAQEVDRLIELPIAQLRRPQTILWERRQRTRPPLDMMDVPYFNVPDARIWGATAMVLAEFVAILDELEGDVL
jgi:8-oxo-dGTP pyrophosphatase MutT (NUDIX family)